MFPVLHLEVYICVAQHGKFFVNHTSLFVIAEVMDQDNNTVVSEQSSRHALRQRCMSALAVSSIQASVMLESTPVLLEVLSSAHTGNLSGKSAASLTNDILFYHNLILSLV